MCSAPCRRFFRAPRFNLFVQISNFSPLIVYLAGFLLPNQFFEPILCGDLCSNSAISLQHTEHHPHAHAHGGPPHSHVPFMDARRRGWDYQHEKDWTPGTRQREWDMEGEGRESPSRMDFDDGGIASTQNHSGGPPGWGNMREKDFPDEEYPIESRYYSPKYLSIRAVNRFIEWR